MCLSHCWGDDTSLLIKTLKDNIEDWKRRIPLAMLPQTFVDAVRITRDLKIRYLWVDSLCIIQDDPQDWERESAEMASIYKNSYLTIAATASKDSSEGCFRSRKPFSVLLKPGVERTKPDPSQILLVYPDSENTIYQYMLEAPLHARGWAFQEMFLSPRTLHFCEDQLFWQCLEQTATEDGLIDFGSYSRHYNKISSVLEGTLGMKLHFAKC